MFSRTFENAMASQSLGKVLSCGIEMTKDIVAELICNDSELFKEIGLHDKNHRIMLMKKIVFSFISIKGKHRCRSVNYEESSLTRHKKTKEIIFKHE